MLRTSAETRAGVSKKVQISPVHSINQLKTKPTGCPDSFQHKAHKYSVINVLKLRFYITKKVFKTN
jgi:hypothetical protein